MKTAYKFTIVSSLLLIAGCSAWHEKQAKNEQTFESYSTASTSGGSFQPSATQSTTSETSTGAAAQTQAFGQIGGGQTEVVTQVQKQLTQDPSLAPLVPNLQICFQNGTVVLAGNVPSEQEKQKIETIVKGTTGVANVNNQLQVSTQSELNLPGETENKQAVGGTSDQSATAQSTGTQASQPAATQSANEQPLPNATTQPSPTGQQPLDQSSVEPSKPYQFGQSIQSDFTLTNQSSTTSPDQNLSPTADQQGTNIYNTNQSTLGTSDAALGKGTADSFDVKIQAATEADRTLGQQVVQELKTDTSLAALLPKIRLNVESGKITLSGTVKSEDQKQKIESAVKRVTGVANVEDHLRVSVSSSNGTTQDTQQENK